MRLNLARVFSHNEFRNKTGFRPIGRRVRSGTGFRLHHSFIPDLSPLVKFSNWRSPKRVLIVDVLGTEQSTRQFRSTGNGSSKVTYTCVVRTVRNIIQVTTGKDMVDGEDDRHKALLWEKDRGDDTRRYQHPGF